MNNYELYHYGVLGMKWGVRRANRRQAKIDRMRAKAKNDNWSDDAKEASESRIKGTKRLSNAELKRLNERLRLEKEYANLTKKDKSAISTGKKFCTDLMVESGKEVGKQYVTKYAKKGIDKVVSRMLRSIRSKDL